MYDSYQSYFPKTQQHMRQLNVFKQTKLMNKPRIPKVYELDTLL